MMDACVKHRIVGSILVATIALVISPLFLKETKPAWMVKEDERSLKIPEAPKPIEVAVLKHDEQWTMPAKAVQIITDNKPAKKIEIAQLAFAEQQSVLSGKTKQAIIEEQIAAFAENSVTNSNTSKGNKSKRSRPAFPKDMPYFSLQLATFTNETMAKELLQKLEAQGVEGYLIDRASSSGATFIMLRTGKMSDLAEIKRLQTKLDKALNVHSLVIKNIPLNKGKIK